MKIVQISSLWETTPPPLYGGLEIVVSNLTEELVKMGHDVTLFATGDSKTKAKLKATYPRALYRDGVDWSSMYDTLTHAAEAIKYAHEVNADVIHSHLAPRSLAIGSLSKIPIVNTVHGSTDPKLLWDDRKRVYSKYKDQNFIAISNQQKEQNPDLSWVGTVYNGIDVDKFSFQANPKADYLLWVGRITPNKAPDKAIAIAKKAGIKLLMVAKIDKNLASDVKYYEEKVKPHLKEGEVEYLGELGDEKIELYQNALAFINPLQWNEPFGLVVAESMACGTPVIAYERGSMRELIEHGKTGYIIKPDDEDAMVEAIKSVRDINRQDCRSRVEEKFSIQAMAKGYLAAYEEVILKNRNG